MYRRELLGTVGSGTVGLAGLLGIRARGTGGDTETDETTTRETTTSETATRETATSETTRETATNETTDRGEPFDGIESSADRPFATISVGRRTSVRNAGNDRPHAIRVWNDSDRARTLGLRLARGGESDGVGRSDESSAALDRQVEFPPDGYLTVELLEPGDYALAVAPSDAGRDEALVEIPRSRFDCKDSRTDVRVAPDGTLRSATTATEIGCPPEVVGETFTAFRGACGSADDASVTFADGTVAVSGSIRVPNPCYGARLADVSIPDGDTLRVTVAATDPSGGACIQCVGSVEYAADLRFRDRVPETVEVVHRRDGQSTVVTTVTRGGSSGDETTARDGTTTRDETTTRDGTTTGDR